MLTYLYFFWDGFSGEAVVVPDLGRVRLRDAVVSHATLGDTASSVVRLRDYAVTNAE